MKYAKEINAFKKTIQEQYKNNDCSKPVKGSKTLQIIVEEKEGGRAYVWLKYNEEFKRMFGRLNGCWQEVYEGDLKTACNVARELKNETKLPIKFWAYEPIEYI